MPYLVPSEEFPDPRAAPLHVEAEYDDGNGMWITSGVSPDLCTCLRDGVRRSATLPPESRTPLPPTSDSPVPSPPNAGLATQQASAPRTGEALVTRRSLREKALMSGGIPPCAGIIA